VDLATDPLGRTTDYIYDAEGNLTDVQWKSGSSIKRRTCYTVNAPGQVTEQIESTTLTSCSGNKTKFEYDANGNVSAIVDPRFSGQGTPPKTTMTYDGAGRKLTETNELGHTTTWTYDAAGNVLTVKDHLNNTATNTYDAFGNLKTVTDALGNVTTFNYDAANRLTSVVDAAGGVTTYAYDANGNRTSVTNALGKTTTYTYDAINRLVTITDSLGTTTLTYDAASNLTKRVAGSDIYTTAYTYDAAKRLTKTEYRDDDDSSYNILGTVTYTYDNVDNRTKMVDSTGTTNYAYDALNRITSVTFPGPKTVTYQYSNAGNRSRITYPDGKYVDYGYDAANNLTSVTDWQSRVATYAYNNAGMLTTATLPSSTGVTTTYSYDNADRLTSIVNAQGQTTLSSFTYTLNAAGNRTQVVDLEGTTTYGYDGLHRLTSADYPGPDADAYTYDANGNRLTKNGTTYTYGDADQMLTAGGVSYGYDVRGNQTSRGSDTFAWDHENRMTQAVVSGTTASYVYNGDGVRMSRTIGGQAVSYTWDVAAGMPFLLQDGTNTYVYGLGMVYWVDGSGNPTYRLTDALGSTATLIGASGAVVGSYTYDAFGNIRTHTGSSTEFSYTGEQNDPNGFEFLRARYYDAAVGRFLGRDTAEPDYNVPGTLNRFAYVLNSPVNLTDPSGLYPMCEGMDATQLAMLAAAGIDAAVGCPDSTEFGLPYDPPVYCYDSGTFCLFANGDVYWMDLPSFGPIGTATCLVPGVAGACLQISDLLPIANLPELIAAALAVTPRDIVGAALAGAACAPYGYVAGSLVAALLFPSPNSIRIGGVIGGAGAFIVAGVADLAGIPLSEACIPH
jgi:RHS repeat-associated protein